ncbi:MAG: hypothetical protein M3Y07_03070 [Acidobacteriota bacterium]|nr:hypothetical protein [Acidobacteriota bacterium]
MENSLSGGHSFEAEVPGTRNGRDTPRQAILKSIELNPNRIWAKQQLEKTPA